MVTSVTPCWANICLKGWEAREDGDGGPSPDGLQTLRWTRHCCETPMLSQPTEPTVKVEATRMTVERPWPRPGDRPKSRCNSRFCLFSYTTCQTSIQDWGQGGPHWRKLPGENTLMNERHKFLLSLWWLWWSTQLLTHLWGGEWNTTYPI